LIIKNEEKKTRKAHIYAIATLFYSEKICTLGLKRRRRKVIQFFSSLDMAKDSTSSPIKPYQQIIASGSGAVLTAIFMTLAIPEIYSRLKNYSFYSFLIARYLKKKSFIHKDE